MNLFLIGYRCTGKTTVGKSIAAAIDWLFVDSDDLVVKECRKNIADIIDTEGWQAFRRMERSVIGRVCTRDRQIVATGGGAVLDADNVMEMKKSGTIVWLRATDGTIRERMLQDKNRRTFRPALTDKEPGAEIRDVLQARHPCYQNASDFSISTDDLSIEDIAGQIIEKMHRKKGA